jgi:hypothetical protein
LGVFDEEMELMPTRLDRPAVHKRTTLDWRWARKHLWRDLDGEVVARAY